MTTKLADHARVTTRDLQVLALASLDMTVLKSDSSVGGSVGRDHVTWLFSGGVTLNYRRGGIMATSVNSCVHEVNYKCNRDKLY